MEMKKQTGEVQKGFICNPELDQYTNKIIFPEKVEYAKQLLKKVGLPKELQKQVEKISQ